MHMHYLGLARYLSGMEAGHGWIDLGNLNPD